MKYAKLMTNDIVDGENICVSFWVQGCPHRCSGCFNPETWDFEGGEEIPTDIKGQIVKALCANGIQRNFSVLGGEPLCDENIEEVENIISSVRTAFPDIKIFVWTGYTLEELKKKENPSIVKILSQIDTLIDGKFEEDKKDITLPLRGSANQRILKRGIDF